MPGLGESAFLTIIILVHI